VAQPEQAARLGFPLKRHEFAASRERFIGDAEHGALPIGSEPHARAPNKFLDLVSSPMDSDSVFVGIDMVGFKVSPMSEYRPHGAYILVCQRHRGNIRMPAAEQIG
jgi:hypothetical protein